MGVFSHETSEKRLNCAHVILPIHTAFHTNITVQKLISNTDIYLIITYDEIHK